MDSIESVLIEFEAKEDERIYANTGLLFANRYVLSTSNVLVPFLGKQQINIRARLRNLKLDELLEPRVLLNFLLEVNVVIGNNNYNTTNNDDKIVQYKKGTLIRLFVSENLRKTCDKILRDWTFDFPEEEGQFKDALSLFFIFEIDAQVNNMHHLNACLSKIWTHAKAAQVQIGQKVCVESVPFGNRNFLKSFSQGIVSNLVDCLILTDVPTAPGSEGGPMFVNKSPKEVKKIVIGIVISSACWWKGEWTGLTIGASLSNLLEPFVINKKKYFRPQRQRLQMQNVLDVLENSVAQITSGTSWGTAILLDKSQGVFLSNSHVIETDDNRVTLTWNGEKMEAQVIFKTNPEKAFDLAIVIANNKKILNATQMKPIKVSVDQLQIAERVFAVGFPLLNPMPTLTSGHVSQINSFMVKTTCAVLPGSSGGAFLRPNGALVGVIVCNTKLQNGEAPVYPRVNLGVPITTVYGTILNFLKNGDVATLQKLQVEDVSVNKLWNLVDSKL